MNKQWWVYVMKNTKDAYYIAVTNNLYKAICEFRASDILSKGGFKLVYTEKFRSFQEAKFYEQLARSKFKRLQASS
jgi:predicted GIY-YIG superfamily endonuclease